MGQVRPRDVADLLINRCVICRSNREQAKFPASVRSVSIPASVNLDFPSPSDRESSRKFQIEHSRREKDIERDTRYLFESSFNC